MNQPRKEQQKLVSFLIRQGIDDPRFLKAISEVPKHKFVHPVLAHKCYENISIPIEHGQYINEPFITGHLFKAAEIKDTDIVFEVGTGSGYDAALLTYLCAEVYSAETIGKLALEASFRLQKLGYKVFQCIDNGFTASRFKKKFDVIIISTTTNTELYELIKKLNPGGRLVKISDDCGKIRITKIKKDDEEKIFHEEIYPKYLDKLNQKSYETNCPG